MFATAVVGGLLAIHTSVMLTPAPAPVPPPTRLYVRGELRDMEPVPATSGAGLSETLGWLTTRDFIAMAATNSSRQAWHELRRRVERRHEFRVAVLGSSVTGGCGSRDPNAFCSMDTSWVRFMHDRLQVRGATMRMAVRTSVYAKNAVPTKFFQHCTNQMLPKDADVVLLELQNNLFEDNGDVRSACVALGMLVQAVRRTAPAARVVFVNWIRPHWLVEWQRNVQYIATLAVAQMFGADVLDAHALLRQRPHREWFAKNGKDHHPNLAGHQLLGALSAWYLQHRLVPRAAVSAAPLDGGAVAEMRAFGFPHVSEQLRAASHNSSQGMRASLVRQRGHGQKQHPSAEQQAAEAKRKLSHIESSVATGEVCYQRANELPVRALSGSWQLRDEGGDKAVEKLGFVSTQVGDWLELSPLLRLTSNSSGSSDRREQQCARELKVRMEESGAQSPRAHSCTRFACALRFAPRARGLLAHEHFTTEAQPVRIRSTLPCVMKAWVAKHRMFRCLAVTLSREPDCLGCYRLSDICRYA